MSKFRTIDNLQSLVPPNFFVGKEWRSAWEQSFPDLAFDQYIYDEKFLICVLKNATNTRNGLPFTDVGGVFPLQDAILDISELQADIQQEWKKNFTLSVNTIFCRVKENIPELQSGLVDYKLSLKEFTTQEELVKSFRKTLRHVVVKSPDFRIEITKPTTSADVYTLYCQTVREKMNIVLPKDIFDTVFFHPNTEVYQAYEGKKLIGFSLFINYPTYSHYYFSGVKKRFRQKQVAHHLLYKKICADFDNGKECITLGGTREDGELNTFKRGWGAQACPIYMLTDTAKNTRLRESPVRKLWRYIPLFLLPKLSAYFLRKML